MVLQQQWSEGSYTPEQMKHLQHIETHAPRWHWSRRTAGKPKDAVQAGGLKGPWHVHERRAKRGSSTDEATTGTLGEALAAMQRHGGGCVGVSLLHARAGLIGVDIDECVIDGQPTPLGLAAIQRFGDAYCELSPSGSGLHFLVLGTVPAGASVKVTVEGQSTEIYPAAEKGRFLRITGDVIAGSAGVIRECQVGIDWLVGEWAKVKGASPDKVSQRGSGAGREPASGEIVAVPGGSAEDPFSQLATRRGERDPAEILAAMQQGAANQPRGKLASALSGDFAPWSGDRSKVDYFLFCEAVRRGADSPESAGEVLRGTVAGQREKASRTDYILRTATDAARAVLAEPPRKRSAKDASFDLASLLGAEVLASIEAAGDKLVQSKRGLTALFSNLVVLLRHVPELRGVVGFNALKQRPVRLQEWPVFDRHAATNVGGTLTDDDLSRVALHMSQRYGMRLSSEEISAGVMLVANDWTFDPLADALNALEWDGVPRLSGWLCEFLKADSTGCTEYIAAVSRCSLIGAVARALQPGCQHDCVLTLEGAGGAGKSTALRALADSILPGLFTDAVGDLTSAKNVAEHASGRWFIELAELSAVRRAADVESLKAAISKTDDEFRFPYARHPTSLPRRFVLVASTNSREYLSDSTGALLRRFWPVKVSASEASPIDRDALARVAPQLFAEAVVAYRAGEKWHIGADDGPAYDQWTAGREARREAGPFHDDAVAELMRWAVQEPGVERPLKEIAGKVGAIRDYDGSVSDAKGLASTLRSLGAQDRKNSAGMKVWRLPPAAVQDFTHRARALELEALA
jgi:Virulence-associated protein E